MSDMNIVRGLDIAQYASALGGNAAAETIVKQKRTRLYKYVHPADDSMATDATAETFFENVEFAGQVRNCYAWAKTTITGHASNHFTATLKSKVAADATAKATLGTYTSDTDVTAQGTLTAGIRKAFDISACTDLVVQAGSGLTLTIAKGGAGVIVKAGTTFVVEVEEDGGGA